MNKIQVIAILLALFLTIAVVHSVKEQGVKETLKKIVGLK
mgnify:CR=1 FL=1